MSATPRPSRAAWLGPLAFAAFLLASIATLSGDWAALFSAEAIAGMGKFARGFVPPAVDAPFLAKVAVGALETLAISLVGTLLAVAGGLALALPAAGRWGRPTRGIARLALNVLRAVPELVWAALVVVAAGLGPFAGTLALGIHTTGVLGRLFAESLENAPAAPYDALRNNGAGALPAFWYATLPQVLPQLASYTLYRWENNIRAAAVLGVVGAGGLGQLLYFHLSLFQTEEASTILIAMLALVGIVDVASNRVRIAMTR